MRKIRFYRLFFAAVLFLSGCAALQERRNEEEIASVLSLMNQACKFKEPDVFMSHVSTRFEGRDELKIAVENDFAAFAGLEYSTGVLNVVENEQTGVYTAAVLYSRQAVSFRFGDYNKNGETLLNFVREDGSFKLLSMPSPRLYGLIAP